MKENLNVFIAFLLNTLNVYILTVYLIHLPIETQILAFCFSSVPIEAFGLDEMFELLAKVTEEFGLFELFIGNSELFEMFADFEEPEMFENSELSKMIVMLFVKMFEDFDLLK